MINVRENVLFWNEGGLPFGLSLEDLKSEHNSRPRNSLIANACFFAGYIDTWGRGTLKIIDACLKAGLPELVIREMNGGVQITVFLSEVAESGLVDDAKGGQVSGQVGGQVEHFLAEFGTIASRTKIDSEINKEILMNNFGVFSEYLRTTFGVILEEFGKEFGKGSEKEIPNWYFVLELIVFYPEITAEEAAGILGISSRATEKHIKKLKDSGIIERMGGRKEGIWQIKKQA